MQNKGPTSYEVQPPSAPPKNDLCEQSPSYPIYYFFCGTLTAPATLQRIIDLPGEPKLRKATLVGYALAKWGDYFALIDGDPGQEVSGWAHMVQTREAAQKLAYYETSAYEEVDCRILFLDDEAPGEALGKTFKYAGDANALLEQRFDRKLWLRQAKGKLF